jgi:hypothetical protein
MKTTFHWGLSSHLLVEGKQPFLLCTQEEWWCTLLPYQCPMARTAWPHNPRGQGSRLFICKTFLTRVQPGGEGPCTPWSPLWHKHLWLKVHIIWQTVDNTVFILVAQISLVPTGAFCPVRAFALYSRCCLPECAAVDAQAVSSLYWRFLFMTSFYYLGDLRLWVDTAPVLLGILPQSFSNAS